MFALNEEIGNHHRIPERIPQDRNDFLRYGRIAAETSSGLLMAVEEVNTEMQPEAFRYIILMEEKRRLSRAALSMRISQQYHVELKNAETASLRKTTMAIRELRIIHAKKLEEFSSHVAMKK